MRFPGATKAVTGAGAGRVARLLGALLLIALLPASQRSVRTFARPLPVPFASTNLYWAGYILTSQPGFVDVEATWTVPPIACPAHGATQSTVYAWIGEGGYLSGLSDPLIQGGTASDCFGDLSRYHAFYEWYPGIFATDFPIAVAAGDIVTFKVAETQSGVWSISVRDRTRHEQSQVTTQFAADARSADFIIERPTVCGTTVCDQWNLARFGSFTFDAVHTVAVPGTPTLRIPLALIDSASRPLAVPALIPRQTQSFSILWRSAT